MNQIYIFLFLMISTCNMAQTPQIKISTKNNLPEEQEIAQKLKSVLSDYDLSRYIFTDRVIIEKGVIPHSHPILTLNTRSKASEDLLSVFIHEQLHWYLDSKPEAERKALAKFKSRYKNVPYKNRAGARDEYSTYMHLIICYLEYKIVATYIGEQASKQLMWNQTHYTWIYNKVLEETSYIAGILKDSGIDLLKE